MATCRSRSTLPLSLRSLTAFLVKVARRPTQTRPMRANLRRKQGPQQAALPRSIPLGFDLGFHFLHVCYELTNRLLTLRTYIRELDALALLICPHDDTSGVNGHGGDWQLE